MTKTKTYMVYVELSGGVDFDSIEITAENANDAIIEAVDQAYDHVREMSLGEWVEVGEVEAKEKRCTGE
jgi:hypothetical protein